MLKPNAIDMMLFLAAYPYWTMLIFAAVATLYGVCAYGSRTRFLCENCMSNFIASLGQTTLAQEAASFFAQDGGNPCD